jgi:hypothetical protein
MENREMLRSTPTIPEFVYEKLPPSLKELFLEFTDPREKDVILLTSIVVASGCLDGVTGRYDRNRVKPPLYAYIVAPSATSKSSAKFVRYMGDPMHNKLLEENAILVQQYQAELKKWEKLRNRTSDPPKKPSLKFLWLPANTSAASLYDRLYKNGGKGIIFETEGDALNGSLKQEWGSFSDGLRKAFHHEQISVSRKTDDTYFIIDKPSLAVFLTGTADQFCTLIKSPENGLFSRFIYIGYSPDLEWKDTRPCDSCTDPESLFIRKGEEVLKISEWLSKNPVEVGLSNEQFDKLNAHFSGKINEIKRTDHEDEASTIKRLGLICFRISMILSIFRQIVPGRKLEKLICNEDDFEIALTLVDTFLEHARVMLKMLGNGPLRGPETNRMVEFFTQLPEEFTKDQANEIGIAQISLSARTVTNYLTRLRNAGNIDRISFGVYRKRGES